MAEQGRGYPRPQFEREAWLSLDGAWDFRFEDADWRTIRVPFAYQAALSGIGTNRPCDRVAYRRAFRVPADWRGRSVILHFGAVDYECDVFVNGQRVGGHTGGNIGFALDITDALTWDGETVVVEVWDPWDDETIPRGKQYWLEQPGSIWYTRTTGIWQSVWLEPVDACRIESLRFTGDVDAGRMAIEWQVSPAAVGCECALEVSLRGRPLQALRFPIRECSGTATVDIFNGHIFRKNYHNAGWCWTPESPTLFDLSVELVRDGERRDAVRSYFAFRKIEARDGQIYLNNKPYYQKLVLDQGYWPDGVMTAPDDDALRADIEQAKAMGFNGCRKHQKAEDPRFLYWADRLGYLVWGEIGACAAFSDQSVRRLMAEWAEAVRRDYNHPSVVCWVVINESWGVPEIARSPRQQALAKALYYQCKALDPTRLVVGNDGWEMAVSDICAIHDYDHGAPDDAAAQARFAGALRTRESLLGIRPGGRSLYVGGGAYDGAPIVLSEFGGISMQNAVDGAWGYTQVGDAEAFAKEYRRVLEAVGASDALCGFCYTQLCDVEQETNGLLTADRRFKADPRVIRAINDAVGSF